MDIKEFLESDDGKAAVEAAVSEATGGLKAKRDELLETNRRLRAELAERQGDVTKASARLTAAEGMVQTLLVDAGLTEALTKAKVAPEFLEAARALIKAKQEIAIGEAEGKPVAMIGDQSVPQFVESWTQGDAGRHFVAPAGNAGGGAAGGAGNAGRQPNPWSKETRNLGEQARLLREDPALAGRLKTEAGGT